MADKRKAGSFVPGTEMVFDDGYTHILVGPCGERSCRPCGFRLLQIRAGEASDGRHPNGLINRFPLQFAFTALKRMLAEKVSPGAITGISPWPLFTESVRCATGSKQKNV